MIKEVIERHIKQITKEIIGKNRREIKARIQNMKDRGFSDAQIEEEIQKAVRVFFQKDMDCTDERLFAVLDLLPEVAEFGKVFYEFRIKMDGFKSWRKIRISAVSNIAELAYAVIAAFNGTGKHVYLVEYDGRRYAPDVFQLPSDNARERLLCQLGLQEKSKLIVVYDLVEMWEFECTLTKIGLKEEFLPCPELLSGKGYGIWENHLFYLKLLIDDPSEMVTGRDGRKQRVDLLAKQENIHETEQQDLDDMFLAYEMIRYIYESLPREF